MGFQPSPSADVFGTSIIKMVRRTENFSMIPCSWSDAWIDRRMTDAAMKIVHFLCRRSTGFKITHRNLAKQLGMGLATVTAAIANLHDLGVALKHLTDSRATGYEIDLNIVIPGSSYEEFLKTKGSAGVSKTETPRVSETETGRFQNRNMGVSETETIYKIGLEDTSLRSEERAASSLRSEPASARPVATISVAGDGQVGFSFTDDQGVIPESDIQRIMADIRKTSSKGDPEDYELRQFITDRIAFMTSDTFKGQKLARGGKEVTQANRNRVMSFCMRIIDKPDFRWSSKRVEPAKRGRADAIRQQIAGLMRKAETYRMQDGSEISIAEYDAKMLDLQSHRTDLIAKRLKLRPKSIDPQRYRSKLEAITLEDVAKYIYGDKAPSHIPADEDRSEYRRQISALRAELSAMG